MSKTTDLTSDSFRSTVESGVTLVDFWAEWCGPCLMVAPVLDELAQDYADKATIGRVDCDKEGELAQTFGVSAIPTLLIMKDGQEFKRFVGVTAKTELAKALDAALA